MVNKYYLAIDIGASSGRFILGSIVNGKLVLEEIYRFKNYVSEKNGEYFWDISHLEKCIIDGLKQCKKVGKIPISIGIDTWGVDYALLDKNDKLIGKVFSYRDQRTEKILDKVFSIINAKELYLRTGIQPLPYNTIFQLYSDKETGKIDNAETMLFTPDYLSFFLTGKKQSEYTIASTSGLINAKTREWDWDIIDRLGLKKSIFKSLSNPGSVVGRLRDEVKKEIGFDAIVIAPASHDTASAVMAVPEVDNPLYISSGTWSLMGIENQSEYTGDDARISGFTNEGGFNKSIRFLKNIMGLWMIQCIKKEFEDKYSFSDFVVEAEKAKDFESLVEVNDKSFFAPASMIQAVKDFCAKTGQKIPESVGEIVRCVYNSLAKSYKDTADDIERIYKTKFNAISIVGGGCQNELLNKLTAKWTGKTVVAGPVEATATGNILAQMIADGAVKSLTEGKKIISDSFNVKTYSSEGK